MIHQSPSVRPPLQTAHLLLSFTLNKSVSEIIVKNVINQPPTVKGEFKQKNKKKENSI